MKTLISLLFLCSHQRRDTPIWEKVFCPAASLERDFWPRWVPEEQRHNALGLFQTYPMSNASFNLPFVVPISVCLQATPSAWRLAHFFQEKKDFWPNSGAPRGRNRPWSALRQIQIRIWRPNSDVCRSFWWGWFFVAALRNVDGRCQVRCCTLGFCTAAKRRMRLDNVLNEESMEEHEAILRGSTSK